MSVGQCVFLVCFFLLKPTSNFLDDRETDVPSKAYKRFALRGLPS